MTTYSARGVEQALLPRKNLKAKIGMLNFIDGNKAYKNAEPIELDSKDGPCVGPGDKIILLEYVGDISAFWEIEFVGAE